MGMAFRFVILFAIAMVEPRVTGATSRADALPADSIAARVDRYLSACTELGRFTAGPIPLAPTEFYMPLGDGKAMFSLDKDGAAASVNMRYGGEDHIGQRVP